MPTDLTAVTKAGIPATFGNVLSIAHSAGMQSSFPLLLKNYKFSEVRFFGRIFGKAKDYLVAVGIEHTWLGEKKFFFWCAPQHPRRGRIRLVSAYSLHLLSPAICSLPARAGDSRYSDQDGVSWAQLPTPTAADQANCAKLPNMLLTGDPSSQTTGISLLSLWRASEDEPAQATVDEVLRLAVIVQTIDYEAAMAPVGSLSMSATGSVVANPSFTGIDKATAMNASGYVFVNKAKPKDALASSAKKVMLVSLDFLVSCDDFVPKGALCCGFDDASSVVTVRNLVWPGFLAYTMPGLAYWGYCYFGTGEKNVDIAFMLH
ncbi:MAG: hypothetical protein SGPRY_009953 [Prymnesium sp.]